MLFRAETLAKIANGTVDLAFRRWKRPSVRLGGTLLTPIGVLEIVSVRGCSERSISNEEAIRAGFDSRSALLKELALREGELTRIEFRFAGVDPRIELRDQDELSPSEMSTIQSRLTRLAKTWPVPPVQLLRAIHRHPEGTPAAKLAATVGMERDPFKLKVRVLKNMGLTESLGIGYRVSPRGERVLKHMA